MHFFGKVEGKYKNLLSYFLLGKVEVSNFLKREIKKYIYPFSKLKTVWKNSNLYDQKYNYIFFSSNFKVTPHLVRLWH